MKKEKIKEAVALVPMVKILNIFCQVERLAEYEPEWAHFSLNLSAALTGLPANITEADARANLRLWEWEWVNLEARGIIPGTNRTRRIPPARIEIIRDGAQAANANFVRELGAEFDETFTGFGISPFLWSKGGDGLNEKEIGEQQRDWKSFLAHVSTFAAPLPQGIKLTTVFRIRNADLAGFDEIVVAPVFVGAPLPGRAPKTPAANDDVNDPASPLRRVDFGVTAALGERVPFFYEWEYDGARLQAFAYQKECRTAEPAEAGEFLNMKTLWLRKPAASTEFKYDWSLRLETKIADAFDMPARLLDGLRAALNKMSEMSDVSPAPPPAEIEKLRVPDEFISAFIASLRDAANFGLSIPPDGNNFPQTTDDALLKYKDSLAQFVLSHEKLGLTKLKQTQILARFAASEPQNPEQQILFFENWKTSVLNSISKFENVADKRTILPMTPVFDANLKIYLERVKEYLSALERIYAALADEKVLLDIFLENWKQVLKDIPLNRTQNIWETKSADIRTILSNLQLRKRLLLGNAGIAWRTLRGRLDNRAELKMIIEQALFDYYENRFEPAAIADSPYLNYSPRPGKIPDATPDLLPGSESDSFEDQITVSLSAFAEKIVRENIFPLANPADDADGAIETLVLQVDKMERDGAEKDVADQSDLVRRLAGIGVLLRRVEEPLRDWRCLNLARLIIRGNVVVAPPVVPVPIKLQYRNGVRQVFVSYDNQPLIAQSPAADLSQARLMKPGDDFAEDGEVEMPDATAQFISFLNPYGLDANAPQLEGLIYGKNYEAAVFLIGSAGNLPKEITKTIAQRKIPYSFAPPAKEAVFNGATLFPLAFRRRVKIGSIRCGQASAVRKSAGQETERLDLPPIPPNVHPLTRSKFSEDNNPLVLLVPPDRRLWNDLGKTSFKFSIRPPSVDLKVWDRWIADGSNPAMKRERETIWAQYYERNDAVGTDDKKLGEDATLDDPAVAAFIFRLERKTPTSPTAPLTATLPVQFNGNAQGLKLTQSDPIDVEIESDATAPATLIAETKTVKIKIPAGEIWRLEIKPQFSTGAQGKFDSMIWAKITAPEMKNTVFDIEVAKSFFNENTLNRYSQNLHNAVQIRHEPKGDRLQINIAPVAEIKDLIYGIDVLVQRWRWDGRPICYFDGARTKDVVLWPTYGFPFDKVNDDGSVADDFADYDGVFFGARESSDHQSIPKQKDFANIDVELPMPLTNPLYDEELTGSAGALYFRAAVRASSRYAALMRRDTTLDSRLPPAGVRRAENWKRLVVKARYNKPVPRPAIKLIVPLTQTIREAVVPHAQTIIKKVETPGLLVILDEAAYVDSVGGLAERFECEVVRVARPDFPNETRAEIGADPILDMSEDPYRESKITMPSAIGAIGYTFDTNTLAPLFDKASFIQPPPEIEVSVGDEGDSREVTDLSWHFLKLRFRRKLDPNGLFKTNGQTPNTSHSSDWTAPVWLQLLPAANRFRVQEGNSIETIDVADLRLTGSPNITLERKSGGAVAPLPAQTQTGGKSKFVLFALVTKLVTDAFGRSGQEAFVEFKRAENLAKLKNLPGTRIRLVEIQYRDGANVSEEEIFKTLFPQQRATAQVSVEQQIDAGARVVRISPVIDGES